MVVKSILLCDFYKAEKNCQEMLGEAIHILSVCYSRFYSYLFQDQNVSERISKILYLLRLLIEQCGLNFIADNEEFISLFIKEVYRRNYMIKWNQVPYDKISEFIAVISSYDNVYSDYNIEGTNISINNLIDKMNIKDGTRKSV